MDDDAAIPRKRPDGAGPSDRALHLIEIAAIAIAMVARAVAAVLIFASVLGRIFLGTSIPDDVILAGNLMPLIVTLPLAYVATRRGQFEVEVFTHFLPARGRLALSLFGNAMGLVIFSLIAWSTWNVVVSDDARGRFYEGVLRIPQRPPEAFFVAGLTLLSLRLCFNAAQDIAALIRGDRADARSMPHGSDRAGLMEPFTLVIAGMATALILLALRVPVAFALGAAALSGIFFYFAFPASGGFTPTG